MKSILTTLLLITATIKLSAQTPPLPPGFIMTNGVLVPLPPMTAVPIPMTTSFVSVPNQTNGLRQRLTTFYVNCPNGHGKFHLPAGIITTNGGRSVTGGTVIERAITLSQGGVITTNDLPPHIRLQESTPPLSADNLAELFSGLPNLDEIERRYILHVLDATGNNRKRTAEILGINRKTLYRMAARYEIEFGSLSSRPD